MHYGHGTASCGSWTADRKANRWLPVAEWVLGWVSAVNSYVRVPARETDFQAISAWVDDYCAAHPLAQLADAVDALVVELGTKW